MTIPTKKTDAILVFAKAPVPGFVKTRLARKLSPEQAAQLQIKLIDVTLATTVKLAETNIELWCAPDTKHPHFQACNTKFSIRLKTQQGNDLGDRMLHAADSALQQYRYVVMIGTDCPDITQTYLRSAFDYLKQGYDVVLGPAVDGGYVLLGLQRTHASLFTQIPWGSDRVLELTRDRLRQLNWHWQELETLHDIDRPDDLVHYSSLVDNLGV